MCWHLSPWPSVDLQKQLEEERSKREEVRERVCLACDAPLVAGGEQSGGSQREVSGFH